jgi:hypothetical protein
VSVPTSSTEPTLPEDGRWPATLVAFALQPHQDVGALAFQAALQLDGVVARVEHEQRDRPARPGLPTQQVLHLSHSHLVGVFLRADAPRVRRGNPRVALEGEPGD